MELINQHNELELLEEIQILKAQITVLTNNTGFYEEYNCTILEYTNKQIQKLSK